MSEDQFTQIPGGVCAPEGFVGNAIACGIKNPTATRLDMAVLYSLDKCISSGVFTTNRVKAAPVRLSKKRVQGTQNIRAIIANSGNANACTGSRGMEDARIMAKLVADHLAILPQAVGICSTGVIGLPMPMARIKPKIEELMVELRPDAGEDIAKAIITSDTTYKEISIEYMQGDVPVRIGACAKGAGMISPNMATMICLVSTDASITKGLLNKALADGVNKSFNRITIDGDMSTNDTVLVLANGAAKAEHINAQNDDYKLFCKALNFVLLEMAKRVVRDGERVTKFVTVNVTGARTVKDAQKVAEAVAKSSLVKCSWNGGDPNWGRIIHAIGYSQAPVSEGKIDIDIAGLPACRRGLAAGTPTDALREAVQAHSFSVDINLNQGPYTYTVYTTDLSPEYVDFNRSEYAYWNQAIADGLSK